MRRHAMKSVILILLLTMVAPSVLSSPEGVPDVNFYFGNLHAHTSYSDGMGTPTEAYSQVSTIGGMDFFSLTEHGYYFQQTTNIHLWYKSIQEAEAFYVPGKFVSLVGYEWTHSEGHMNGYGTPIAASRDTQRDFASFMDFMHEYDGIATFNHPNPDIQPNWNDFSYWKSADDITCMLEVGSGAYNRNTRNEPSYVKALDRGWKVGAVNNQDNHKNDWGSAAEVRTGLVAKELTRASVLEAMRFMRTYSTEDRNARALIWIGDNLMGDTITTDGPAAGKRMKVGILAEDPDGDSYSRIDVITNGGKVAASIGPSKGGVYYADVELLHDYSYFYARMVEADGDRIVTSPIWVETGAGLVASDFSVEDTFLVKGRQASFYARVADRTGSMASEVGYELYAKNTGGYVKEAEGLLSISPGRWAHLTIPFVPDMEGAMELKLVLSSPAGPQSFSAGRYEVLDKEPMRLAVDEGHNNRLTSYYTGLVDLAKSMGYEGGVLDGEIGKGSLEGLKLLVLPLPEQGFALTPTYYEEEELAAMAGWVEDGGSLLLLGWGDIGDGSRDFKDFATLLGLLEVRASFYSDMLVFKGANATSATVSLQSGTYKIAFTEGCSLTLKEGAAGTVLIARTPGLNSKTEAGLAESPVFVAAFERGKGKVMLIGSVPFSDYELKKSGFDNTKFTASVLGWLMEGRW